MQDVKFRLEFLATIERDYLREVVACAKPWSNDSESQEFEYEKLRSHNHPSPTRTARLQQTKGRIKDLSPAINVKSTSITPVI